MPPSNPDLNHHPQVITFLCKDALTSFRATPIPSMLHYNILSLSLEGPNFRLHIVNFYHHMKRHEGNLHNLLNASIDHMVPTLLAGNFNTHFRLWLPASKKISPWSETLENWLNLVGFFSTVPENAVSCRSSTSRPSLIDFIFINEAFLKVPSYPCLCSVSFAVSLGSDHASLSLSLPYSLTLKTLTQPPGWIMDTSKKDEWIALFQEFPMPTISNKPSLLRAGQDLLHHITMVSDKLFPKKRVPHACNLPWWSQESSLAVASL
jgi:Endonuclease-reverse transcriptase